MREKAWVYPNSTMYTLVIRRIPIIHNYEISFCISHNLILCILSLLHH